MSEVHVWDVPGRVNLIGEHLDYNGGPVLPMAIDRRLTVKLRLRDDGVVNAWTSGSSAGTQKTSLPVTIEPGAADGWAAYVAGTVWSLARSGHAIPGADIVLESDLPTGAGLSSSAALTCGIAAAVDDVLGLGLSRLEVARIAQRVENDFVGAPVGLMDQLAVLLGEPGHAVMIDFGPEPPAAHAVPVPWEDAGLTLLVVSTGVHHQLADGEYAARRTECETAAAQLGLEHLAQAGVDAVLKLDDPVLKARTRHVVTETARVRGAAKAVSQGAWTQFGTMLTASHTSLRDDFEVSCPELDIAVEAALEGGALGARMTGGGFGGSIIALVPRDRAAAVRELVEARYAAREWKLPETFAVSPAAGAHARRSPER